MATLALMALGSQVSGWAGYALATAGAAIGNYIDRTYLFAGTTRVSGPRINETPVQTSSYGTPIPLVWGAMRLPGMLIWEADRIVKTEREEQQVGKGGGGQTIITTTYTTFQTFAVMLCEGAIEGVSHIWADEKLIYSASSTNESVTKIEGLEFRVYLGTETQDPDPWMEAADGAGNVPGYRGRAYIVFNKFPLEKFGQRIPNISARVVKDVSYTIPDYDISEVTATLSDNMVMMPDGYHAVVEDSGTWERFIPLTRDLIFSANLSGSNIPYQSDFDVDERGRIHTVKYSGGVQRLVQIDGTTFSELSDSDTVTYSTPNIARVRVSRDAAYPWLCFMRGTAAGDAFYFRHRDDYTGGYSVSIAGYYPKSMCFNHSARVIYCLFTYEASPAASAILTVTVDDSGAISDDFQGLTVAGGVEICYDADTNQVLVGCDDGTIYFYDADDLTTIIGSVAGTPTAYFKSMFQQGPVDGYLYAGINPRTVKRINITTLDVDTYTTDDTGVSLSSRSIYDRYSNSLIVASFNSGETLKKIIVDRFQSVDSNIGGIVDDLCDEAGLDSSIYADTSDLSGVAVPGFTVNGRMPSRDAIAPLAEVFLFDGVDSDGKITFVARTGSANVTMTENDLAARTAGDETPQRLIRVRRDEWELPRSIEVAYLDPDNAYNLGTQRELRETVQALDQQTMRLPMALSADEARQIVAKKMAQAWYERISYEIVTSRKFAYVNPTDVVALTMNNGDVHTFRVTNVDNEGGLVRISGVRDGAHIYSSAFTGYSPSTAEAVSFPGPTVYAIIDVPLLSSKVNEPGMLVAGIGYTDAWTGAQVYQGSYGFGPGFLKHAWQRIKTAAIMGRAQNALGDVADPFLWDNANTLTVRMYPGGVLESATEAQVLNGANHFVLMTDDCTVAEICAFCGVTDNGGGSYTLSKLLRGRKGSDYDTGNHTAGEIFVLLDEDTLQFGETDIGDINTTKYYRAISVGMRLEAGTVGNREQVAYFRNMKPLSPQHVAGSRDGSNNLTISWIRRTRLGGEWKDEVDAALSQDSEEYEVDIIDNSSAGGGAVVRTIDGLDSAEATYSAANQTADGLTPGDPVDVVVYQMSAEPNASGVTSRRGFGASATV